jgi:RNA polymerase sigma factor (sigma-70 family)
MSDWNENEMEKLRPRLRFRVAREVGFGSADIDDLVQETLTRFLLAAREGRVRENVAGAFLSSVCRNVIFEHRRRMRRTSLLPEVTEPPDTRASGVERFEIRDGISRSMARLSDRDREILYAFYIDEKPKEEIYGAFGLTYEQFRVVLCRAKERFRNAYNAQRGAMVGAPAEA